MTWLPDAALDHLRQVSSAPDFSGTQYSIQRAIGRGGMATVYLAKDSELDREVAIKVLDLPDASGDLANRMLREAKVVARLEHPGIVPIHDVGVLPDDRVFYVMKYVRGERLDSFVKKTMPERLRVFQRICEAVAFAHAQGVIHRDLKPENVMVGAFGEVLVMDWGLAKLVDSPAENRRAQNGATVPSNTAITDHGTILGTPAYMAPEQASGQIEKLNERTDVYSLGAILYFLLTGSSPAEKRSDLETPRKRDPKIPKAIEAVCLHAMEPDQNARYSNASDLSRDIALYLDDLPVAVYRENLYEKSVRWVSRNYFFVLLILAYLFMRVLLLLFTGR